MKNFKNLAEIAYMYMYHLDAPKKQTIVQVKKHRDIYLKLKLYVPSRIDLLKIVQL